MMRLSTIAVWCALLATGCGGASSTGPDTPTPVAGGDPTAATAQPAPEPMIPPEAQPADAHPLAGTWRGATDKMRVVLTLSPAGGADTVQGQACEAIDAGCTPLATGTWKDGTFLFSFQRDEGGKQATYNGKLQIRGDGDTLDGGLHSSACDCMSPLRLVRVK